MQSSPWYYCTSRWILKFSSDQSPHWYLRPIRIPFAAFLHDVQPCDWQLHQQFYHHHVSFLLLLSTFSIQSVLLINIDCSYILHDSLAVGL